MNYTVTAGEERTPRVLVALAFLALPITLIGVLYLCVVSPREGRLATHVNVAVIVAAAAFWDLLTQLPVVTVLLAVLGSLVLLTGCAGTGPRGLPTLAACLMIAGACLIIAGAVFCLGWFIGFRLGEQKPPRIWPRDFLHEADDA